MISYHFCESVTTNMVRINHSIKTFRIAEKSTMNEITLALVMTNPLIMSFTT